MLPKICAVVTAASTSIIALFCVWIATQFMMIARDFEKSMIESPTVGGASHAEMTKDGEEIIRQLNAQTKRLLR